ncbi:hypothetical protein P4053_17650 [Pseudomonas aeruginosa]|nr:hypothetical protein [Pseudomonas aeruginosa]
MFTVKNYGVSFSTKKSDIALTNFFVSLVGADIDFPIRTDSARKIIIDQDEKYIYGTVITIKNQKKFTSLVGKGSNLEIKVSDLSKLEKIAEFNFLIINKKNGFGIYQYHHGSCTAPNFGSMITTLYRRKLEAKRDAEILALGGRDSVPRKQLKAINSRFFHGIEFDMIAQSKDIKKVLEKYKSIRSFRYEVSSLEASLREESPLQGLIEKVRHHVRFDSSVDSSLIISGIQSMIPTIKQATARVEVLDDQDEPVSVKVMDVPANFGEMGYDDFIKNLLTFKMTDIKGCSLFQDLKGKCERIISMSSQKHPLTNSKECWTFVVAAAITALLYVALIITISKEVHLRGFLFLEAGTTAKIFEFYAENLRGSLFTGFLALGGFLMSAKTFIIVNMKKEVYDSAKYKQDWLDGMELNGPENYPPLFRPLRRLSNILFYTISFSFLASIAQLTIGLYESVPSVMVCSFLVILAISFLMLSLYLIKKNLATMFDYLDKSHDPVLPLGDD